MGDSDGISVGDAVGQLDKSQIIGSVGYNVGNAAP